MPKGIPLAKSLRVAKTVICAGCSSKIKLKGGRRNAKKGHWCVDCRSNPHIKSFRNVIARGVNISREDFDNSYKVEHCQCCNIEIAKGGGQGQGSGNKRQIDHCHITGNFRGVLCWNCNSAIGKLGDNIEGLERALSYLKGE